MKTPRYCLHKGTGQAVAYIDRKPVYLGVYDSPESHAKYDVVIARWLSSQSCWLLIAVYGRTCALS